MNKLINVELNEGTGRVVVDSELRDAIVNDLLEDSDLDEHHKFWVKYYMRAAIRKYMTKLFKQS